MIVVPLHAHFRPEHLAHVEREMLRRGPPRLRGFFDCATGLWFAREGTHRLRAAERLGLAPIMVNIRWWRSAQALTNARFAAGRRRHCFTDRR
jgi:hypothetical protein